MQQYRDYEIIAIDNCNNKYNSAAKALNSSLLLLAGDMVLFIHQDFRFLDENQLGRIVDFLCGIDDNSIIGAAGAVIDKKASLIKRIIGRNRLVISNINKYYLKSDMEEVFSVDECCFATRTSTVMRYKFDEKNCSAWDLYCADLCFNIKKNGGKCYVVKIEAEHLSGGNIKFVFYNNLFRLGKKYREYFDTLVTTCVVVHTHFLLFETFKLYGIHFIKKVLRWHG